MTGHARYNKYGNYGQNSFRRYYIIYVCNKAIGYRDCANTGYHGGKRMEDWVKESIKRLPITDEDRSAAQDEVRRILHGQQRDIVAERQSLEDQRDAHLSDLKSLSWRLVREEIPAALYSDMRQEKEAQIQVIDKQLSELDEVRNLDASTKEILDFLAKVDWDDLDHQAWKETLDVLVERVIVEGRGQWRIEWRPGVASLLPPL